jgi:CTP:phosphocholine cytidylyltransferase-like protein
MKDLDEALYVLGIEIHRDRNKMVLWLSQKTCLEKILKKYSTHVCKPMPAPIVKGYKVENFQYLGIQYEFNQIKSVQYASNVRSLMYTQVYTCLDLAFITTTIGRY